MVRPAALCACALGALASAAGAQATVLSARLQAELGGGVATVRLEYLLAGVLPGDSVGVSFLDFGAGAPAGLGVGDAAETVPLPPASGAARRARLVVVSAPGGEARLVVGYRVSVPDDGRPGALVARVPVLTVDLPAVAARPGLFQAEVRVPAAWRVDEAFPTGLTPMEAGALRAQLPVVPSVVTLRYRTDGRRGFPLLPALNLAVAACLALVGIAGWRQLAPRRP